MRKVPREIQAVFAPDWRQGNPYQRLLANALCGVGVHVSFPRINLRRHRLGLPTLEGTPTVFHLHWPAAIVLATTLPRTLAKAIRFLIGLAALRQRGVPIVWTVHELVNHERIFARVELTLGRFLACLADGLIVHGPAAKKTLIRRLAVEDAKVAVIPHGHYLGVYDGRLPQDECRRRLGLAPGATVFLHLRHIRPYKGVPDLLTAFSNLPNADSRLIVAGKVGDPLLQREMESLAERDRRISCVLRFLTEEEVSTYMGAADAVVLPYRDIFTSGSVLLAMSFGKAVVAPNLGNIAEVVATPELLYDPEDPDGLPRSLMKAAAADLKALGTLNLERAKQFDWGPIGEATRAVYAAALARVTL